MGCVRFVDFAVIGEETVDLVFHIADLGDNGGAQATLCRGDHLFPVELVHRFLEMSLALAGLVAVAVAGVEKMSFHRIGIAAKLAEYQRDVRYFQCRPGCKVDVAAVHIGCFLPEPAGGGIKDAAAVQLLQLLVHRLAVTPSRSAVALRQYLALEVEPVFKPVIPL